MLVEGSSASEGYIYKGFPLLNKMDQDYYILKALDDCQVLCRLTKHCHYFNYDSENNYCHLKFGLGEKIIKGNGVFFGYKYGTGTEVMENDQISDGGKSKSSVFGMHLVIIVGSIILLREGFN